MRKLWACLAVLLLMPASGGAEPGAFEGKVVVEWIDEGFVPSMRLVQDFSFRQSEGKLWTAERGRLLEGKAMPPLFRDLVGQPFDGGYRKAAVVYDVAAQKMTEHWQKSQRMFFEASVAEGVPEPEAKIMYLVLAAQGTRWEIPGSRCYGSCHGQAEPLEWRPVVDEVRLGELMKWVRADDPKIEAIDHQVHEAIRAYGPHIFEQPKCNRFSGSTMIRKSCD